MPHRFILTLLDEAPRFKSNRVMDRMLSGWKLGLLETAESGPVFTAITMYRSLRVGAR